MNLNAKNYDEALCWAVSKNYHEVVKLLLKNGANVHARHDDVFLWTEEYDYDKIEAVLREHIRKEAYRR